MQSKEQLIASESSYFVYAPSRNAQEMFLYPLQCGRFVYEAGYSLTRESFDSFLLMYVEKGSFNLETAGQSHTVKAGQLALIDCYARHAYSSAAGWSCFWCHFDGITARKWYESIAARGAMCSPCRTSSRRRGSSPPYMRCSPRAVWCGSRCCQNT